MGTMKEKQKECVKKMLTFCGAKNTIKCIRETTALNYVGGNGDGKGKRDY